MSHVFRLVRLAEQPSVRPSLAALMEQVWPTYYGENGTGNATKDIKRRCHTDKVPMGVVVLTEYGQVVAGGALEQRSFGSKPNEKPWIVGLLVHPQYRRIGIASQVVAMLEAEASRLGHPRVFATVQGAAGLLDRRGWQKIRVAPDGDETWDVMSKSL